MDPVQVITNVPQTTEENKDETKQTEPSVATEDGSPAATPDASQNLQTQEQPVVEAPNFTSTQQPQASETTETTPDSAERIESAKPAAEKSEASIQTIITNTDSITNVPAPETITTVTTNEEATKRGPHDVILQEVLQYAWKPWKLTLTPSDLYWEFQVKPDKVSVPLDWVVGAEQTSEKQFTVYTCSLREGKRERRDFIFTSPNQQSLTDWVNAIRTAVGYNTKRHIVVIVNPFSGTKIAPKIYKQHVAPILKAAGIRVTYIETKYAGHATQIAMDLDLDGVDGMVTVSGDGLFHEALNGLFNRKDWERASRLAVGVVPGGSGNGLAAALATKDPISATLAIVKGNTRPLDLGAAVQNGLKRFFFLSFTWCIIGDIDIESDEYRWMGPARFTVVGIKRGLFLRKYKGRLAYLPDPSPPLHKVQCSPSCVCASFPTKETSPIPTTPEPTTSTTTTSSEVVDASGKPVNPLAAGVQYGPPFNVTHDFNDPPPGWVVVQDQFSYFIVTNISHLSVDTIGGKYAHACDGCFDLIFIKDISSLDMLLSVLNELDSGKYVESPFVEYHKVKAITLEPEGSGIMAIDGERVQYAPVRIQMYQGLANVFGWSPTTRFTA